MKNLFKIVVFLSFGLVLLTSCSDEKSDKEKFLKKLVEIAEDGTTTTTLFKYNGDEIVSTDGVALHTDFTYTNGLITKIRTLDKASNRNSTVEYSYDLDQLIQVLSPGDYVINYIHNADGTVAYERFYLNSSQQETKQYHGILSFQDNNLIKDKRTLDGTEAGVVTTNDVSFEYDQKKNPMHAILGFNKLLDQIQCLSVNNPLIRVVEYKNINAADQITSSVKFYKSTFKYDADNYPTEQLTETADFGYLKLQYFY